MSPSRRSPAPTSDACTGAPSSRPLWLSVSWPGLLETALPSPPGCSCWQGANPQPLLPLPSFARPYSWGYKDRHHKQGTGRGTEQKLRRQWPWRGGLILLELLPAALRRDLQKGPPSGRLGGGGGWVCPAAIWNPPSVAHRPPQSVNQDPDGVKKVRSPRFSTINSFSPSERSPPKCWEGRGSFVEKRSWSQHARQWWRSALQPHPGCPFVGKITVLFPDFLLLQTLWSSDVPVVCFQRRRLA